MRVATGDLTASAFLAIFMIGLFGFVYDTDGDKGWPLLTTMRPLSFFAFAYLIQSTRNGQSRLEGRSVSFPNSIGGGILGVYIERPWYSELAELGRPYKRKKHGPHNKRN